MFDKNLLFLSAFGEACNMAVRGSAVDGKFDRAAISNAVAPWCSATPLSGELLQVSLDALLQNDINLLSAYPDAYVSQSYDGTKAHNGEQFCYFPAGDGQGIETGEDTWNNSVTLSATIGSITGGTKTSGVVLGSLVPAYPFQHGKEWNYGVFTVSEGKPVWKDIDLNELASIAYSADPGETYEIRTNCTSHNVYPNTEYSLSYWMDKPDGQANLSTLFAEADTVLPVLHGDFKKGDVIDTKFNLYHIAQIVKSSDGSYSWYDFGGVSDILLDEWKFEALICSADKDTNKLTFVSPSYSTNLMINSTVRSLCSGYQDEDGDNKTTHTFSGCEGSGETIINVYQDLKDCYVGIRLSHGGYNKDDSTRRLMVGTTCDVNKKFGLESQTRALTALVNIKSTSAYDYQNNPNIDIIERR